MWSTAPRDFRYAANRLAAFPKYCSVRGPRQHCVTGCALLLRPFYVLLASVNLSFARRPGYSVLSFGKFRERAGATEMRLSMNKMMLFFAILSLGPLCWAGSAREDATDRLDNAKNVVHAIMGAPDNGIPEEVLEHAK